MNISVVELASVRPEQPERLRAPALEPVRVAFALRREGHEVALQCESVAALDDGAMQQADQVFLYVTTPESARAVSLARRLSSRGIAVGAFGPHARALPETLLPALPRWEPSPSVAASTSVDWQLVRGIENHRGLVPVDAGDGAGGLRPPEDVARDLAACAALGLRALVIPPAVGADPSYLAALCAALPPMGRSRRWVLQAPASFAPEARVVRRLRRAGLREVVLQLRSEQLTSLALGPFSRGMRRMKLAGLPVHLQMELGGEDESRRSLGLAVALAGRQGFSSLALRAWAPQPGSPAYARLADAGRLLSRHGSDFAGRRVVVRPQRVSVEELHNALAEAHEAALTWGFRPSWFLRTARALAA